MNILCVHKILRGDCMNIEIEAKRECAQMAAQLVELLGLSLKIMDGEELSPRTPISDIVRRISQYGDFPALSRFACAPPAPSGLELAQGELLDRVVTLLTNPDLADTPAARALVEYLGGFQGANSIYIME